MKYELADNNPIDPQASVLKSSVLDAPAHLFCLSEDLDSMEPGIRYLREHDFAVICTAISQHALEKAFNKKPDLILLDLPFSETYGFGLLQALKRNEFTRAIPVLLICSCADISTKVRGFELGASDCVSKPITPAELHARVSAQINRYRFVSLLKRKLVAYQQRYGILNEETELKAQSDLTRLEIQRLHRARQVLRENLARPPSLSALAQSLGTNQPKLSRDFRQMYGTTVFAFIRELRLLRARDLLVNTSMPVKSIALEVGYRNTSDLSRGIKDFFGITPTALRKSCV